MVTTRLHRRLFLLLAMGCLACNSGQDAIERLFRSEASWVDLTHSFNAVAIYWPTAEPFRLDISGPGGALPGTNPPLDRSPPSGLPRSGAGGFSF